MEEGGDGGGGGNAQSCINVEDVKVKKKTHTNTYTKMYICMYIAPKVKISYFEGH